jgi:hypothetical protein
MSQYKHNSFNTPYLKSYVCTKGFLADGLGAIVPRHICSWPRSQHRAFQSHLCSLYHMMNHTRKLQAKWANWKYNTTCANTRFLQRLPVQSASALHLQCSCSALFHSLLSYCTPDEVAHTNKRTGMWVSRGGQVVDISFLGCNAVCTGRHTPTFRRSLLPPFPGPNMGAGCSSERLVCVYKYTRRYNSKNLYRKTNCFSAVTN